MDDDRFQVRERATRRLVAIGPAVEPLVRRAMQGPQSLEARTRARTVLEEIEQGASSLKWKRAAAALRRVGTPAAIALLEEIRQSVAKSGE